MPSFSSRFWFVLTAFVVAAATAPAQVAASSRLLNLSSRGRVVAGQSDLVSGFVIGGVAPKTVLLRGVGPTLANFGVADALAQPRLRLYDAQGRLLREVFGWGGDVTLAATFASVGAFPLAGADSADAALVTTLEPGAYTMEIATVTGAGSVLAEIYDASPAPLAGVERLVNSSSRGFVAPGDVLTGGFVIGGTTSKRVLVRGVGPGLAALAVAAPLAAVHLRVYGGGQLIAENVNWSAVPADAAAIVAAAQAAGAFPLVTGSKDAALIVTLPPGAYTVQVSSTDPTVGGVALVETYEIPGN